MDEPLKLSGCKSALEEAVDAVELSASCRCVFSCADEAGGTTELASSICCDSTCAEDGKADSAAEEPAGRAYVSASDTSEAELESALISE